MVDRMLKFYCHQCRRSVDHIRVDASAYSEVYAVRVYCHGQEESLTLYATDLIDLDWNRVGDAFALTGDDIDVDFDYPEVREERVVRWARFRATDFSPSDPVSPEAVQYVIESRSINSDWLVYDRRGPVRVADFHSPVRWYHPEELRTMYRTPPSETPIVRERHDDGEPVNPFLNYDPSRYWQWRR